MEKQNHLSPFLKGLRDGLPIGAGYFAVAFGLGIAAQKTGMSPLQGFVMSFFNHASAGEYAGVAAIRNGAAYLETALLILIANARYLLMSTALSQKLSPDLSLFHRLLIGFDITDELFGISIAYPGFLDPLYMYGAFLTTTPLWATGTAIGITAGNILPDIVVRSLSAAIYGMFIAVIIPPCRTSRNITIVVLVSFAASWLMSVIPAAAAISEGFRIIILTLIISSLAAIFMPLQDDPDEIREGAE
ncbi:MAG: AzlC family ABC transporter permease [Anaerolineaceae bacterium]|nr:AzlC family ABC transporter permease [Anaerolineaceae bacterium]